MTPDPFPTYVAIKVRGEVVHPECMTPDEALLTVTFLRKHDGDCERCGKPIPEVPRA